MIMECFDPDVELDDDISRFVDDCTEEDMGPGDWLADLDLLPSA